MDDVAILGFGFSGLMTLANLVRDGRVGAVAVVAPDASGRGLAYATTDLAHRLNVPARRMGAWAGEPGHFAGWLGTPAGAHACRELGIALPGPDDFAPRALYARYLDEIRVATLAAAAARGVAVTFHHAEATGLAREGGAWTVIAGPLRVRARRCVLAVGHEARETLAGVPAGPWALRGTTGPGPALVVGTGLTAVDAFLSLRRAGFTGEVVLASRHGLLPRAHRPGVAPCEYAPEELAGLRDADAIAALLRDRVAAGHDWRAAVDGLRPHTTALWQGLCPPAQRAALARWAAPWSVMRHRMAPDVAARLDAERASGALRVLAGRVLPSAGGVLVEPAAGAAEALQPSLVLDCTGTHQDWATSRRPLLRRLVADHAVVGHHTRMGVVGDREGRVGQDLLAVGPALTGQRWESTAVPELREQAATVAAAAARPSREPVAA